MKSAIEEKLNNENLKHLCDLWRDFISQPLDETKRRAINTCLEPLKDMPSDIYIESIFLRDLTQKIQDKYRIKTSPNWYSKEVRPKTSINSFVEVFIIRLISQHGYYEPVGVFKFYPDTDVFEDSNGVDFNISQKYRWCYVYELLPIEY